MPRRYSITTPLEFGLATLAAVGCHAAPAAVRLPVVPPCVQSAPATPPLVLTMWCGPPLDHFDDARAAEIAAAGFTAVGPPCEGPRSRELNRAALDVAARHGLALWVEDHRFGIEAPKDLDWRVHLREAVDEYRHDALGAYFVMDEPTPDQFDAVASIVAELHAAAPDRLAYVNVLPSYIGRYRSDVHAYERYLEDFAAAVRPRLLSYDYYPFLVGRDRSGALDELGRFRRLAQSLGVPWLVVVQAMPHGPYRDPSEGELSWQVFHALAYGALGVSYFAYWTPVDVVGAERWHFRNGIVEHGRPTRHYSEIRRINLAATAIAGALARLRSIAVTDSGIQQPADAPLEGIDAHGVVTIGWYRDDAGRFAALLVNRDHHAAVALRVRLRSGATAPLAFDPTSRCWVGGDQRAFSLPAGGARLLRW